MAKTLIGNVKGPPGDKGKTPYIGENGNWWIDGKDTGVEATAGAAAAQSAAAAAQTAKTAAETAKSGAESAKTAAASSASAAKASETNAASAASSANSSKNAAASSATTAESAAVRAQECLTEVQTKLENGEFDGEDATIESVTAEVDGSYLAQPTVTVTPGGTPSNRTFHFAFKGLRSLSGGGSGGGGTTVQADWSVNDPNDPSHVKERTHWKEVFDGPEGEIIPETSLVFKGNFNFGQLSGMSAGVQIGGKYIVTHNGTDYECVGRDSGDGAYIGNGSLLGYGNLANTGEPFCILAFGGTVYYLYKADKTAETVTVKVVGKKETVWHKLDGGYLPEGMPYSEGVKLTALYSALVEIDPDSGVYEGVADVPLTEGETYVVKYNGVDYVCTCSTMTEGDEYDGMVTFYILGNLGAMTGGDDTGEPFVVMTIPSMGEFVLYALDGSATVDLTISAEAESVQPMAGKFMPKGAPYMQPFDDVILENTVLADVMVESPLGAAYNLPIGAIVPGNIYNVEFDGAVYRTKAYSVTQGELTAVALGSGVLKGGSQIVSGVPFTGDPFLIQIFPAVIQQAYGFNAAITWDYGFGPEESGTQTIAIRGGYTVNKIDNHCLPDGAAPLWVTLTAPSGGDTYEADISKNEVIAALKAKMSVYVLAKDGDEFDVFSGPMAARVSVGHLFFSIGDYNFVWENDGTITKSQTT